MEMVLLQPPAARAACPAGKQCPFNQMDGISSQSFEKQLQIMKGYSLTIRTNWQGIKLIKEATDEHYS
jgi:hypothetical protein